MMALVGLDAPEGVSVKCRPRGGLRAGLRSS